MLMDFPPSPIPGETKPAQDLTLFLDADACPVKDEAYRVSSRYGVKVSVVANAPLRVPVDPRIELVVRAGFGAADDWIASNAAAWDIVVTADVPLAARAVAVGAIVIDPKGRLLTDNNVGAALATRNLMEELRQYGPQSGGPAPMTAKDRSRFLASLDEAIHTSRRGRANRK